MFGFVYTYNIKHVPFEVQAGEFEECLLMLRCVGWPDYWTTLHHIWNTKS
jgi:hypothetical protein